MKHFVLMCLLLYIHTSQSEIHSQRSTEGADVFLYCKHEGKVQWSKDRDGNRLTILTAESKEEIQKHNPDPHNRYSATDDLSLHIKSVSLSDSGIYYCNANPTVNLTVTASDETRSTTSSNSQTEATTPPPVNSTSTISLGVNTSVAQTSNARHTDQPKSTQATTTSENSSVHNSRSQTNTPVTSTTDLSKTSTTSTRSSTRTEETNINTILSSTSTTSSNSQQGATTPPSTESSKIAAAMLGGVVFVVLVLLLWACIKRKATLYNKKENIYETVDDSDFTAQPVPSQKPNDAIYYLAGDPDIVQLGQIKETDDHTYTLISQSKENIIEQEDVPLYSTIKVDTINQP